MDIDFKQIRPLNGDPKNGFEEFCCQMAEEDVKSQKGSDFVCQRFFRKEGKGGDAGVECYYALPDGAEWGWQAKYFIHGVGDSQWRQIDKSVETALKRHPRLERYTVCLPVNLTDFRSPKKKSQMDRWHEHRKKWTQLSSGNGQKIEFVLWGESELRKQLLDLGDRGAGYIHYWFDEKILTTEWFRDRFEETKKDAGPRYTPEIHVDLPLSSQFDSFCRAGSFPETVAGHYDQLLRRWKKAVWWVNIDATKDLTESVTRLGSLIGSLAADIDFARNEPFQQIDFDQLLTLASDSMRETSGIIDIVQTARDGRGDDSRRDRDSTSALESNLFKLQYTLDEFVQFIRQRAIKLVNSRAVLLSGKAGTGKTHFFCDVAQNQIDDDIPIVVLLGQKFTIGSPPWSQIIDQLGLGQVEPDTFLGLLDAAARVRGKRALILIDALNEGPGAGLWRDHLAGMLATLRNYPRVVLAVSCRDSYLDDIVPENLLKSDQMYRLEHRGFEGQEFDATQSFFKHYGIQGATEPLLVPEYSNPLFLKLMCLGLTKKGKRQVPKSMKGISKVFQFFIDSANLKLSRLLGIDSKEEIVHRVVRALAQRMADKQQDWLDREEAKDLIGKIRPEPHEYERSLYRNLIHEGGQKIGMILSGRL